MLCFNSSLLKYGGDLAVGAMTILSSVMQFSMLPLQGLTQGAQPIISFNYGAGNIDRVKKAFHLLLASCLAQHEDLFNPAFIGFDRIGAPDDKVRVLTGFNRSDLIRAAQQLRRLTCQHA